MTGSVHGAIRSFGRADDDAMEGEEEENRERRRRSVGERRGGGGERNGRGNNSSSFRRRQERREEGDKEAFLVEGVAKAEGRREEAECQYPPVIGRRRKGSVVGEMLSRRNVYQVSSPTEKRRGDAGGDDPRLYCDCPVHRKQRERMESNNNNNGDSVGSSSFSDMSKIGGALGSSPGKSFTSWLSNIQLSRTPSAREPSRPPAPASTSLRSSKSLRGERPPPPPKLSRPPLSVEYSNSRFTGSSGEVDGGGGGGGVAVDGRGSDVSRPQVRLQGITRRGTMYPMRTSVSSSEFAAAAAGFGSMVAVGGGGGGTANGNFAPHGSGTLRKGLPQQKASTEV